MAFCLFDKLDDLLCVSELRVIASRLAHHQLLLFHAVHGVSLVRLTVVVSCRCSGRAIVATTLDIVH